MPSEESMIEDLREIEADLREIKEYRKANIIDLFIIYSTHCKIPKSKIKNKIEELEDEIKCENNEKVLIWLYKQKSILQKLLEG